MTQLAVKYRPRMFGDITGQQPSVALLYLMTRKGAVPGGGMLFYGKWGSGKTTLARITARALNCETPPGKASEWPCGTCPNCVAIDEDNSPDVEEIDAASNGSVEKIRTVRERAYYGTMGGRWRVILLDEAQNMSAAAFDALLKLLEEPPPQTLFILLTTQLKSIPATIQSRSSPFRFDPLPVSAIRDRLAYICRAEGFDVEPALLTAIAEAADGSMRDAVVRLDQVTSVGIGTLALWQELTGESDFAPVLLAAAADGNDAAMYAAMDGALAAYGDPGHVTRELVRCLRDLLVLSCSGDVSAQGEALAARQELIGRLGKARVSAAMAALWDLQTRVTAADRETAMVLALNIVSRRLNRPPAPIVADGGRLASIPEMKAIMERA